MVSQEEYTSAFRAAMTTPHVQPENRQARFLSKDPSMLRLADRDIQSLKALGIKTDQ
jgi:hypothetical protein